MAVKTTLSEIAHGALGSSFLNAIKVMYRQAVEGGVFETVESEYEAGVRELIECMLDQSLRGHPVAVGGDPENRHGIILAKNYEAKKFGIQTGEALWQARNKCHNLIIVPPHYEQYMKYSRLAHEIYLDYTNQPSFTIQYQIKK